MLIERSDSARPCCERFFFFVGRGASMAKRGHVGARIDSEQPKGVEIFAGQGVGIGGGEGDEATTLWRSAMPDPRIETKRLQDLVRKYVVRAFFLLHLPRKEDLERND